LRAGGQDPLGPGDIGLEVVFERRGANLGGQMIDDVGSPDGMADRLGIAEIAANDLDSAACNASARGDGAPARAPRRPWRAGRAPDIRPRSLYRRLRRRA